MLLLRSSVELLLFTRFLLRLATSIYSFILMTTGAIWGSATSGGGLVLALGATGAIWGSTTIGWVSILSMLPRVSYVSVGGHYTSSPWVSIWGLLM